MDIWEMLGIPETTDVSAIKRAYAAKVKEVHPAEHPQEFQILREAYQAALDRSAGRSGYLSGINIPEFEELLLKRQESDEKPEAPKRQEEIRQREVSNQLEALNQPEESNQPEEFDFSGVEEVTIETEATQTQKAEKLLFDQILMLLRHPNLRNNRNCWEVFFKQFDDQKCMSKMKNRRALAELLQKKHYELLLSAETWSYFRRLIKPYHLALRSDSEAFFWPFLYMESKKIEDTDTKKLTAIRKWNKSIAGEGLATEQEYENYLNLYFSSNIVYKKSLCIPKSFRKFVSKAFCILAYAIWTMERNGLISGGANVIVLLLIIFCIYIWWWLHN